MTQLATQFLKFAGIGVIGTGAHYTVLISLMELSKATPVVASSAGALVGALINYFLNYQFTFQSNKRHTEALAKFLIIAGIGFVLNGLLMMLLAEQLGFHYLIAQIITTLTVLLWNFFGNRGWTFAHFPR